MKTYSLIEAHDAETQTKIDKISTKKDSKFVLHYLALHTYVTSIRCQLIIADADWKDELESWETFAASKVKQPFGTLPVLRETTSEGDTLIIPESGCIERYLAQKFDQMGTSHCQTLQLEAILSLTDPIVKFWFYNIVMNENEEQQAKYKQEYYEKRLPTWLAYIEQMAVGNGNNGHIIGHKFTFVDAKLVAFMDILLAMDTEAFFTMKAYPALFKIKQTVDTHPRYAEYRKSETYATFSANGQAFFVRHKLAFDYSKANLF